MYNLMEEEPLFKIQVFLYCSMLIIILAASEHIMLLNYQTESQLPIYRIIGLD